MAFWNKKPPEPAKESEGMVQARRRIEKSRRTEADALDLSALGLSSLPEALWQLKHLRTLHAQQNELATLPEALGQLENLEDLRLHANKLTTLPEALGRLTKLRTLFLDQNELTNLPEALGQMRSLRLLIVDKNKLTMLPESMGNLKLTNLFLHENEGLGLPPEILGLEWNEPGTHASPRAILDYYFSHRQAAQSAGTEPLMEAKLLVLGEASVGKSCLIAALTQNKKRHDVPDRGTRGIVRELWKVPVANGELAAAQNNGETLRLNCWDFGGQEIYHSAHTLFLTTRAVYLIVISKRDNERQNNIDYWLRMAASFGGPDAVIYVIVNKCDEPVGFPPDEQALRLRHPQIRGFLQTSCDDLRGIEEARQIIVREALRLDGVRQPVARTWLAVKKKVEEMRDHTLSMDQWCELCGKEVDSTEARRELLHLCDRLGTVRYFPTTKENLVEAKETAILNPEWVTLGIYALLDDKELKARNGLLSRPEMAAILKGNGYPLEHERIIEEVMRRHDLLYDSIDHGEGQRMLIPLMLPDLMPEISWPNEPALEFCYQYAVMPAGLLPAFMARMHRDLSKEGAPWRNGCVLKIKDCRVRIIADRELKRVQISVRGPEPIRRDVLDSVRVTFGALHSAINNLAVDELIPVPGRPDAPLLKYSFIRSLDWKGIKDFEAEGAGAGETITVNVREALDGVRGTEQRKRDEEQRQQVHHHYYREGTQPKFPMGDHIEQNISGGNFIGPVAAKMENCTSIINQQNNAERRRLLQDVEKQARELISRLPADKQEEAADNLELLVKGADEKKPNRPWYSASAAGLLEASKFVKDFTGNIAGAIGQLGKLIWPDYSVPKVKDQQQD